MLSIKVNGETHELERCTLRGALEKLGYDTERRGLAAALNGTLIPRGRWNEQEVDGGDEIEVVAAVQGG